MQCERGSCRLQVACGLQGHRRSLCLSACRIYERLKAEKQAEDDARDERERMVDLMYQEQVCIWPDAVSVQIGQRALQYVMRHCSG